VAGRDAGDELAPGGPGIPREGSAGIEGMLAAVVLAALRWMSSHPVAWASPARLTLLHIFQNQTPKKSIG
jgi:hypothetical protein